MFILKEKNVVTSYLTQDSNKQKIEKESKDPRHLPDQNHFNLENQCRFSVYIFGFMCVVANTTERYLNSRCLLLKPVTNSSLCTWLTSAEVNKQMELWKSSYESPQSPVRPTDG